MIKRARSRRTIVSALLVAFVGSASAVMVNLATEWKYDLFAWLAVVVLTILTGVLTASLASGPAGEKGAARDNEAVLGRLTSDRVTMRARGSNRLKVRGKATVDSLDMTAGYPDDPAGTSRR